MQPSVGLVTPRADASPGAKKNCERHLTQTLGLGTTSRRGGTCMMSLSISVMK